MGNVEYVSNKFSFFELFEKIILAKIVELHNSIESFFIDYCENISISKLTVKTWLKNIPFAL